MIKRTSLGFCAAAVLATAGVASAATEDISSLHACANIHWSVAFLSYFPQAAAACRDVTQKNGITYARFDGRVAEVDPNIVQVQITDVANIPIAKVAFKTGAGGTVVIDDEVVKVRDLKVDDKLTFWLRDGQFGTASPPSDQRVAIIQPEAAFAP
jgi:hypothetical protein